jgi:hypothetical protein
MEPIDKEKSRAWRRSARDILNRQWDPIGVWFADGSGVEDEYDRYAGGLAGMVRDNASDEELARYLSWVEAEHMGLGRFDGERIARVVAAIRELGRP